MCGIYGTTIQYNINEIKSKLERTSFRGPDQLRLKTYNNSLKAITFGHNRLSIIDLDARSDQPFSYNHVHIVYNGEVYNFQSIKSKLETLGYKFRTTSDTEVICAAYLEYGEDCPNHFNGMFAFVIYDEKKQYFFGARDRLGQKPFYYYHNGLDFEFSSQIASIQIANSNLSISSKAVNYYLAWGNVPDPMSIFNEVSKLKAGHSFVYKLNSGKINIKQFWDLECKGKNKFNGSFEDAKFHLKELLNDSVKTRLFADVPVGVFLSGGIDSSLIAATASNSTSEKIKTFSVKFNDEGFDESKYAKLVADHLKTDHHIIECNYNEGIELIKDFSYYFDEPFSDSSAIPTMLLSKYTKKHVTVALSGDAGDESFIGYSRYDWMRKGDFIMKFPPGLRKVAASLLNIHPNYRFKILAEFLNHENSNIAYLNAMTATDKSWFNFEGMLNISERKYLEHDAKNLFERITDFDLKTYLNWDINTKVDRASMAYSLEVRAPLLDYRIVEFARLLPTKFKYHKGVKKHILKEILYDFVPKQIFDRPKSGFTMPFATWFKEDLKDYVLSELNDEGLKTIPGINVEKIKLMIAQHIDGTWNRSSMIWSLLVLKQWLETNGKNIPIK